MQVVTEVEEAFDVRELELWVVVSHLMVVLRIELRSPGR